MQPARSSARAAAALVCLIGLIAAASAQRPQAKAAPAAAAPKGCTVASANDFVLGSTQLLGNKNSSDAIWHDELPSFRAHGPLSRLTMYRAFFYDGIWHDPGELKGLQFWYGPDHQPPIYEYKDGDSNLLGARKPHIPMQFDLAEGELITKAEVQWDPISMRYIAFTTNKGRSLAWGFKDVAGATKAFVEAPVPGSYLAAVRGLEGKPAAVSKKRYIIQLSFVWALPTCKPAGAAGGAAVPLEASRLAAAGSTAGPANLYLLDKETAELLPQGMEGANIIYDGVSIVAPPVELAATITPATGSSSSSGAGSDKKAAAEIDASKHAAEAGTKAAAAKGSSGSGSSEADERISSRWVTVG